MANHERLKPRVEALEPAYGSCHFSALALRNVAIKHVGEIDHLEETQASVS
jgi:hypothetical protein